MSASPQASWTAEQDTQLRQWIAEGHSFSEIGVSFGRSRNAAIGRAYRLGLAREQKPKPRALHWTGFPKRKSPDRKAPMIVDGHQSPKVECVPLNTRFLDTTNEQCKYIIGDANGAETICCGLPSQEGKPYCWHHDHACHVITRGARPNLSSLPRKLSKRAVNISNIINPIDPDERGFSPEQLPDVAKEAAMSPLQVAVLKARYARPPEPVPEPMKIQIADPQAERIKRLEDVLRKAAIEHPLPPIKPEYPSVKSIVDAVAEEYGVLVTDIMSHRRHVSVTFPRHVAMYLCKVLTVYSFPEIGRKFGGRDHTTAIAAVRKITKILEYSEALRERIDRLAVKIKAEYSVVAA